MSLPKPYYSRDGITIYHGDCREILPHLKADVVVTDPPYGVGIEYGGVYSDSFEEWCALVDDALPKMRTSSSLTMLTTSKLEGERHIWTTHQPDWRLCWYKGALSTRCHVGFKDWEPVFIWGSMRRPMHDHFHAAPEAFNTFGHPCPKPTSWAHRLITMGTKSSDSILDPFMGSGTTLVAAKLEGRKAIGIEIEERYCEIAVKRLSQGVLNFEAPQ